MKAGLETPLTGTMTNNEDQGEMRHKAAFHHGMYCLIFIQRNIYHQSFRNYNLQHLNIYNGQSCLY